MSIQTVKELEDGYLVNGVMHVPFSPGNGDYVLVQEWIAEGNTPGQEFTPAEPLANAKTKKRGELIIEHEVAAHADVVVDGKVYPADRDYQTIILTLSSRQNRGRPIPTELRGKDGNPVPLTPALLDQIEDALFNQVVSAFNTLADKMAQVDRAEATVEEIQAITFTGQ